MQDTNNFYNLRQRAEQQLTQLSGKIDSKEISETKRLLHELDVYNTELDIQNEELKRIQVELNESRDMFFQLYNQAPVGYLVVDHNGLIVQANDTLQGMVNSLSVLKDGNSISKCIYEEDRKIFLSRFRSFVLHPENKNMDLRWIGKDNKIIWVKITGRNIKSHLLYKKQNNNSQLLLLIITDITQTKEIELALEEAKQSAEDLSKTKSQFMANMSHEIRTPMNGVLGMAELLSHSKLNKQQTQQVDNICTSGKTLLRIINDILDFSKIEANSIELENCTFNLNELLQFVLGSFSRQAEKKNLTITYKFNNDFSKNIYGDSTRLSQILFNLIGNAIKFTDEGIVSLDVTITQKENNQVNISFVISDTGVGIPDIYHKQIFNAFSQANSSISRKYGGTGLGLVICQQLVELMGGKLQFKSQEQLGSQFYFDLNFPISQSHNTEVNFKAHQENTFTFFDKSNLRILIAEDNEISQQVALQYFELSGYQFIDIVENGLEALRAFSQNKYDIIFMDCEMPVLDGYQATEAIRERELNDQKKPIPIIALTAHAFEDNRRKTKQVGMDDFIVKPYTFNELNTKLSKWLNIPNIQKSTDTNNIIEFVNSQNNNELIDKKVLEQLNDAKTTGNTNFISTLANIYVKQLPEAIIELEDSLIKNDNEHIKNLAHKLKSSSKTLGIIKLGLLYEEIENNYQDLTKVTKLKSEIEKLFPKVLNKLNHYLYDKDDQT
ncbi:MAG: ATP-binding protein [Gammaproteobacteria bacterium]|nr:ATP-binding protein [Gammaproteobacteria bacterium]